MKFDIINPRTDDRRQIELDLSSAVMSAAKIDIAVAEFVAGLVREKIPHGFMILGSDLRTP
jgi:hypothetical protein